MEVQPSIGRYQETQRQRAVGVAWEDFIENGCVDSKDLQPEVKKSWMRCLSQGVQPSASPTANPPLNLDIEKLSHEYRELISALGLVKNNIVSILQETDSLLLLANPEGSLVDVCGSNSLLGTAKTECVAPGYVWNESSAGTNAIGTAIESCQPIEINAQEHFCHAAKSWSCAAVPIFDLGDRSMLGIVDITTQKSKYSRHNMAVALSTASQLEQIIRASDLKAQIELLSWYHEMNSGAVRRNMVLIDKKGRIVQSDLHTRRPVSVGSELEDVFKRQLKSNASELTEDRVVEQLEATLAAGTGTVTIEQFGKQKDWHGGIVFLDDDKRSSNLQYTTPPTRSRTSSSNSSNDPFHEIIGSSQVLVDAKHRAGRLAKSAAPVLILGETGTGKELFANAIHRASSVSDGPFIEVNCGAYTSELAGSELFGYERGAFTGANPKGRVGQFELANGGTLFLDEIGELPLDIQVMLLRVLQNGQVTKIGGSIPRKVNTRVIAATNKDLETEVAEGRFRRDLYHRLHVLSVVIPPLRNRNSDVLTLSNAFLSEFAERQESQMAILDDPVADALTRYSWPGNVRELKNVLESMSVLSGDQRLELTDLPEEIAVNEIIVEDDAAATVQAGNLREIERLAIIEALDAQGNNMSKVAKHLGIARSTLYRKLDDHRISSS